MLINDRFLLARFHMDTLQTKNTIKAVRDTLKTLPKGSHALDAAYEEVIARIDQQDDDDKALAKQVLAWVIFSARPLTINELLVAIAFMANPDLQEVTYEDLVDESQLTSVCAGLVVIDSKDQIVRLVHKTAEQFLESKKDTWLKLARTDLAKTCLNYLLSGTFDSIIISAANELVSGFLARPTSLDFPFAQYASTFWGLHAASEKDIISGTLVRDLFCAMHRDRARCLAMDFLMDRRYGWGYLSVMEYLAHFNLCTLARTYLAIHGADRVNTTRDEPRGGPLHIAVEHGHLEFLELLLTFPELDVNVLGLDNTTVLLRSARDGRKAVVEVLVARSDIQINLTDDRLFRAIDRATESGHYEIVEILQDHPDFDCATRRLTREELRFLAGARQGHTDIVMQLLGSAKQHYLDVNVKDRLGRTAVSYAAAAGHVTVLNILLAVPGIDVNCADGAEEFALSYAAHARQEECVAALLTSSSIDVNARTKKGSSALDIAISNRCEPVVAALLAHPDTIATSRDMPNHNALIRAVLRSTDAIVRMLIDHPRTDINAPGGGGMTALSYAVQQSAYPAKPSARKIIETLLTHPEISLLADNSKQQDTPLHRACYHRETSVVKLLLAHKDALLAVKSKNKQGRTPLDMARFGWFSHDLEPTLLDFMAKHGIEEGQLTTKDEVELSNHLGTMSIDP